MSRVKVGDVYPSNSAGMMEVVGYKDAKNVTIVFVDTGYITTAQAVHIRQGKVKDVMLPSVFGVGYVGQGRHLSRKDSKNTPAYEAWSHMLKRCYDPVFQERNPTYIGCTVVEEWHNYQVFTSWFYQQDWEGKAMDKDTLYPGNKVYGPDTCVMVTRSINNLLVKVDAARGNEPLGVCFIQERGKYQASLCINGKKKHLGFSSTSSEASAVYNEAKANHIQSVAMQQVDNRIKRGLFMWSEIFRNGLADAPIELVKQKLGFNY